MILPSSHPSSIQLYSPPSSTLLSELEVSPSNRVSRRDEKPILPARVENVVVSLSGLWMATVDSRVGDGDFRPEVYLKFWTWAQKDESWVLNTRIDRPHGTSIVTDLGFNPCVREDESFTLVSTGEDGYIKLWQLRSQPRSMTSMFTSHSSLPKVFYACNRYMGFLCNIELPVRNSKISIVVTRFFPFFRCCWSSCCSIRPLYETASLESDRSGWSGHSRRSFYWRHRTTSISINRTNLDIVGFSSRAWYLSLFFFHLSDIN